MHRRDTEDAEFSEVGGGRRVSWVVMCDTGRRCGRLMILTQEM